MTRISARAGHATFRQTGAGPFMLLLVNALQPFVPWRDTSYDLRRLTFGPRPERPVPWHRSCAGRSGITCLQPISARPGEVWAPTDLMERRPRLTTAEPARVLPVARSGACRCPARPVGRPRGSKPMTLPDGRPVSDRRSRVNGGSFRGENCLVLPGCGCGARFVECIRAVVPVTGRQHVHLWHVVRSRDRHHHHFERILRADQCNHGRAFGQP